MGYFFAWDERKQVMNAVEARPLFVDSLDDPPRRLGDVRVLDHRLFCFRVCLPAPARFEIHRAEFPLLQGMRCVMRLMTPPFPAASRPSNSTTTLSFS